MTIFRISFVRISEIEMKTKKGKDMTCEEVLEWLAAHANPEFREGMVRFGIDARLAVGVRVVDLRRLAREIGRDHALALETKLVEMARWRPEAEAQLRDAAELADRHYRLGAVPVATYLEVQNQ